MNENIFNHVEEVQIEANSFSRSDQQVQRPPGNCPPGHYKAIQSCGNGHWVGDSCGCETPNGPSASIDFLIYPLVFVAFVMIVVFKINEKKK